MSDSGTAEAGTNGGIREEPTMRFETRLLSSWLRRPRPKPCDSELDERMSCGDGIMKASLARSRLPELEVCVGALGPAAAAELPAAGFVDWGVCEAPVEVGQRLEVGMLELVLGNESKVCNT
jgi:hypothetical protein